VPENHAQNGAGDQRDACEDSVLKLLSKVGANNAFLFVVATVNSAMARSIAIVSPS